MLLSFLGKETEETGQFSEPTWYAVLLQDDLYESWYLSSLRGSSKPDNSLSTKGKQPFCCMCAIVTESGKKFCKYFDRIDFMGIRCNNGNNGNSGVKESRGANPHTMNRPTPAYTKKMHYKQIFFSLNNRVIWNSSWNCGLRSIMALKTRRLEQEHVFLWHSVFVIPIENER